MLVYVGMALDILWVACENLGILNLGRVEVTEHTQKVALEQRWRNRTCKFKPHRNNNLCDFKGINLIAGSLLEVLRLG